MDKRALNPRLECVMTVSPLSCCEALPLPADADPRWARVVARDAQADGEFWYAVATTGIYCRPSCGSRLARPEHVRFFDRVADAVAAGYRACKRCNPNEDGEGDTHVAAVVRACRRIEADEHVPSLETLARDAGLSRFHFHRLFRKIVGLTPHDYGKAWRAGRVRAALQDEPSVTAAAYAAGYGSTGRFYAESEAMLGMTPSRFRAGGADTAIRFAIAASSLGALLVAASPRGICAIALGENPDLLARDLQDRFPLATLVGDDPQFAETIAQVVGLVEAPHRRFDLPLDIRGTAFQQRVWLALRAIPPGTTLSYTELAQKVGAPRAVRAVASACAANTLAIAVPCHRVVRQDGSLSGYRWGVERKRELLAREKSSASSCQSPVEAPGERSESASRTTAGVKSGT
jgi:AraC family transcriptional regulator of adaptative response/methylated-DNA-[protein]-cysteine methyltransferase